MFKKEYKMKKKNNKKRSRSSLTKKKYLSFGPIGCNDVVSIQIVE